MIKYCENCQKEFDFKIQSVKDLDNLICPECGNVVDKNAKKPVEPGKQDQVEKMVTKGYATYIWLKYTVLLLSVLIGVIAYFAGWNQVLYITTFLGTFVYVLIFGTFDLIYVVAGAIIGGIALKTIRGICLGILIAVFIRRVVLRLMFKVVSLLVREGNKAN